MTLFENREIEALYILSAKSSLRAKVVPPGITAFALVLTVFALYLTGMGSEDVVKDVMLSMPIDVAGVAGLAVSCAWTCRRRVQYQLRAASLGLAVTTATLTFCHLIFLRYSADQIQGLDYAIIGPLSLLWVCQKALVISDVVAARVLVVIVPFNTLVLLTASAWQVNKLLPLVESGNFTLTAVVHTALELGTSVLACSGVLLWLALRNESASRAVFYWSRVVGVNVETLDAEANPFHQRRLLHWLSRDAKSQEMVHMSNVHEANGREFWELDGALLRLKCKIAAGGGGVVWSATYNGNRVAAKQLYGGLCSKSEQLHELAMEVSVLAQLSHVNIVRFLGLCRHSGDSKPHNSVYLPLFIVQEYCPTNLRAMLTTVFPSMQSAEWQSEVHRVALEIASAMAYLHSRRVLHHDLKPENVLLTSQRTVRVADFGLSVQVLERSNFSESIGGTPAYMSPTALCRSFAASGIMTDENPVDEMPNDAYAYGVILCELTHSDSNAGIVDHLVQNAARNRELCAMEHSTASDVDFQCEWMLPPFRDDAELPVRRYSELGRRCCAFYPDERPSFASISREFARWAHEGSTAARPLAQKRVDMERHRRFRSATDTGNSFDSGDLDKAPSMRAQLSTASIEPAADVAVDNSKQVAVEMCGCSCWTRHELRFDDRDMERRFVAFLHSDEFFQYLRWPYVVLAVLQLCFTVTMFAVGQQHYALYPFACTVLFGVAALLSWVRRLRPFSMVTLLTLALVAAGVQCAIVWADLFVATDFNSSGGNFTVCVCDAMLSGECPAPCQRKVDEFLFINFLLPLLQDVTIPVTLLVLGLPWYLYVWLLAVSVVSWMGTIDGGLAVCWGVVHTSVLVQIGLSAIPGLALFPICVVTAIAGERTRRQMFLKLCSLRTQEKGLLECAMFRGYREALLANWRFLAASPGSDDRSRPSHVVTAATV